MRVSESGKRTLKSPVAFLNPRCVFRSPQALRFLSPPQQGLLLTLAFFIFLLLYGRLDHPSSLPVSAERFHEVVVEVSGEVPHPGIYLFKTRPSLKEALEKAGGIRDVGPVPQSLSSEEVETGTRIVVAKENPDEIRVKSGRMEAKKLLVFSIPLDLNRASLEDLSLIPGIGDALAKEIIALRQKKRPFRSIQELKEVKGMGHKKWEKVYPYVTVNRGGK
jgi:competence protein ComEA